MICDGPLSTPTPCFKILWHWGSLVVQAVHCCVFSESSAIWRWHWMVILGQTWEYKLWSLLIVSSGLFVCQHRRLLISEAQGISSKGGWNTTPYYWVTRATVLIEVISSSMLVLENLLFGLCTGIAAQAVGICIHLKRGKSYLTFREGFPIINPLWNSLQSTQIQYWANIPKNKFSAEVNFALLYKSMEG